MKNNFLTPLLAFGLLVGLAGGARAELFAVSPDLTIEDVAGGIPAGFPLWYQDFSDPAASPDANPNYGIGPSPGGLILELCPDLSVDPNCISDVAGGESFWWSSDALMPTSVGQALLVLAVEGTYLNGAPVAGEEITFGRLRIRVDVPVGGTYTVTHPFGVQVFNNVVAADGINFPEDLGCLSIPCDFSLTLDSNVGPFLFWDADLPVTSATGFYVGTPGIEHRVLGSPLGTNFFRVDGPAGSNLGGPGIDFVQTDLFAVSGKVFLGNGQNAPVAVNEPGIITTAAATPVIIDVLANDTFTDIPINPGSLTITAQPTGGTAVKTVVDGQVRVSYTPNPGFTGQDTFSYTVAGFTGLVSAAATVTTLVEDLAINQAALQGKLLKWRIEGTSSDTTANTVKLISGPLQLNATLNGSQEVPPVTSAGSGTGSVTLSDDLASLAFTFTTTGLLNTTLAHIHVGAPGVPGPIIFNLILTPNFSGASGTLTAADLVPQPAVGINNYDDALQALLSGQTYINVHTGANPSGEIRGQLGPARLIGVVPVGANGVWSFSGKSKAVPPAGGGTILAISANGVATPATVLQRR
jgi:hypothetical protein